MLKIYINNEEVVANQNFTINKHMLNTPSVILNNVCPKSWCENKDYSNFYHPQDYSKCKIQDETYYPDLPGTTVSSTNASLTINDVDTTKLYELTQIEGDTSQSGTPTPTSPQPINVVSGRQDINVLGKNIFDYTTSTFSDPYRVNITTEDNTITMTTTATTTSGNLFFYTKIPDNTLENGATYTISSENVSGVVQSLKLQLRNKNGSAAGKPQVDSVVYDDTYSLYVVRNIFATNNQTSIPAGTTAIIKNVMVEKSSTPTPYEAYKGQSYEINLGKNLFDISTANYTYKCTLSNEVYTTNSLTTSDRSVNFGYSANNNYTIYPNETYYISADIRLVSGTAKNVNVLAMNSSGTRPMITNPDFTNEFQRYLGSYTNNTENPKVLGRLLFQPVNANLDNAVFEIKNVMVSKSSNSTYAPYKTPIELCKIENYKDRIYKLDHDSKNLFNKSIDYSYRTNEYITEETTTTGKRLTWTSSSSYTYQFIAYTIMDLTDYVGKTIRFKCDFKASASNTGNYVIGLCDADNSNRIGKATANGISGTTISFEVPEITNQLKYLYVGLYVNSDGMIAQNNYVDYKNIILTIDNEDMSYAPYGTAGTWYIEKQVGKVVLNGSENWSKASTTALDRFSTSFSNLNTLGYSNYFTISQSWTSTLGTIMTNNDKNGLFVNYSSYGTTTLAQFKTWLSTHNTIVYYVLATPTYTEITDSELISQLNALQLLEGLNNISISSGDLPGEITIHYNYQIEHTDIDLLFCGVVKNSGKISLNPREPHFTTLQILDFKDFLSSGETLDYVIYQKTILEAIQQVIDSISDYGFVLGNINILNPNEVIGAYSTKDKTAYDVFNYIADITQSRWTARMVDENTVAIDFYDPTLMTQGTAIDYTQSYFENNLIDDMKYNYGTNNYRNKQIMVSNQVIGNLAQIQTLYSNGYQDQYIVDLPIAQIDSIYVDGEKKEVATEEDKYLGINADFYYSVNSNVIESEKIYTASSKIEINYVPIIEGRQVITNNDEISRINTSTGRKGIVSRYEQRNDATTLLELQKIGESYIKYKGTPEIVLTIDSRKNLWEVGQRVQFNAPVDELDTEYMVRTKKINYIVSVDTLFYTYELVSSFNSETEINYFDNQRAKSKGNIGDGEYISRNIDIENVANVIFYDTTATEITLTGDNTLNSILNSPFID